jgi:hypothetical protein
MIHGVVEHQDSVLSPAMIFTIEMVDKLPYEVTKGDAVGSPVVDGIVHFTSVGHSSYDVELGQALAVSDEVLNTLDQPTMPSVIGCSEVALINIDDPPAFMHGFNILSSCILTLELCCWKVLVGVDLLNLPIGDSQLTAKKLGHGHSARFDEAESTHLLDDIGYLKWLSRAHQHLLDEMPHSFMVLGKGLLTLPSVKGLDGIDDVELLDSIETKERHLQALRNLYHREIALKHKVACFS